MAEVKVTIGGRGYPIVCDDGQEERVAALAARIEAEARAFSGAASLPEARLLLMSALMIADKLDEAEARLAAAPKPAPAPPPEDLFSGMSAQDAAARVEAAAKRIAALTAPIADAPSRSVPPTSEADADDGAGQGESEPDPEPDENDMNPDQMRAIRRERRRQRMVAANSE